MVDKAVSGYREHKMAAKICFWKNNEHWSISKMKALFQIRSPTSKAHLLKNKKENLYICMFIYIYIHLSYVLIAKDSFSVASAVV